jgi:hypothetical protein
MADLLCQCLVESPIEISIVIHHRATVEIIHWARPRHQWARVIPQCPTAPVTATLVIIAESRRHIPMVTITVQCVSQAGVRLRHCLAGVKEDVGEIAKPFPVKVLKRDCIQSQLILLRVVCNC